MSQYLGRVTVLWVAHWPNLANRRDTATCRQFMRAMGQIMVSNQTETTNSIQT